MGNPIRWRGLRNEIIDPRAVPSPPWMRGPIASRFLYSVGALLDFSLDWLWQGIRARFADYAPHDALLTSASDNGLVKGPTETWASLRNRNKNAREAWSQWGLPEGQLRQARTYFLPDVPLMRLVTGNADFSEWFTLERGIVDVVVNQTSLWDWDSQDPWRAPLTTRGRSWLIVYAPSHLQVQPSGIIPNSNESLGVRWDHRSGVDIAQIAHSWRQASTQITGLFVVFDDRLFDPDGSSPAGTYPDGHWYRNTRPDGTLTRPTAARYFPLFQRPSPFAPEVD